ncbi:hypothetical protein [Pontibacter sp. G13]|uniref:hypothetical protein n=1 Tax=Pontibacter sp. G13 TaxID=3074898 RepID=UPI00288ACFF6|nr:hypothetical protein [Pontibacter sp. G13]WNJ19306.1 hypothetical protein RJD25_02340 [Pontibacter sp. G13]
MNRLFLICLLAVMSIATVRAQSLDSLFMKVENLRQQRITHYSDSLRDSVFQLFEAAIIEIAAHPEFCHLTPQDSAEDTTSYSGRDYAYSFMNHSTWVFSPDGRLRICSWDDLGGGSYHSYTNYLQFRDESGACTTLPIDTATYSTEVGYFKIAQAEIESGRLYIALGYGTYGGGKQHYRVRFFQLEEGTLREREAWYPDGQELTVVCNRPQNPELTYDPDTQTISYLEFEYDEDTGFYNETFTRRKILLK